VLAFEFEGHRLEAAPGQTIAAVLVAHGVRVFGRSAKFHRPRGVRCANGTCSSCAMRVDGLPGVRTCVTPVRDGMRVEREHAWPSADHDLLRVAELAGPVLRAGSYYRWFRRSPHLWRLAERGLSAAAGQGELPALVDADRFSGARCRILHGVDVLVVGGGVAGLSAGLAAARAGAHTLLVERHQAVGGGLAADTALHPEAAAMVGASAAADGGEVAGALAGQARAQAGLELVPGAEVVGWYQEGVVALVRDLDLLLCEPRSVVLATGDHEVVPPFVNGDLPGVMTAGAVQRLLEVHRVRPGRVATVLANDARGYHVAAQLAAAGVIVACIADLRQDGQVPDALGSALGPYGIRVLAGVRGMRAHGLNSVRAVTLRVQARGAVAERPVKLASDLVCVCLGARPADELARQALAFGRYALSTGQVWPPGFAASSPDTTAAATPPGGAALFAAGGTGGARSAATAIAGAAAAGRAAAKAASEARDR